MRGVVRHDGVDTGCRAEPYAIPIPGSPAQEGFVRDWYGVVRGGAGHQLRYRLRSRPQRAHFYAVLGDHGGGVVGRVGGYGGGWGG